MESNSLAELYISKFQVLESFAEMGLSYMLIESLRFYLSCILAEIVLQKRFHMLQIGRANKGCSRSFVWLY